MYRTHYTEQKPSSGGGIGIGAVVQIVFIILKLCKLIDWPWVWVLSPTWTGLIFLCVILLIAFVIAVVSWIHHR